MPIYQTSFHGNTDRLIRLIQDDNGIDLMSLPHRHPVRGNGDMMYCLLL
jgi:hypothetical protein